MKQIDWISLGLILGTFSCQSPTEQSASVDPPNVIFIFTDDLGYGDLTCYNQESKIHTPNIDLLAKEGMYFTDAHTSASICTPSRYGLLTGRYCWRSEFKHGVHGGYDLPIIEPDRLTLGKLFQDAGYKTAAIGKWHVGMEWTPKEGYTVEDQEEWTVDHSKPIRISPIDHGFDYYFGTSGCTSDDSPFAFIENRKVLGLPLEPLLDLNVTGDADYLKDVLKTKDWQHEMADTIFTNRAIHFIKEQQNQDQPFFVYLALSLPHIPWDPAEFVKGKTGVGPRGDLVALTDYCVGRIDSALDEMGLKESTLVLFSSDNGPRQGINDHASAGQLRGYKGSIYEGGHRVPLIARWPGNISKGTVSAETVCMVDFMATFADLLESGLPPDEAEDSYSILPIFLSEKFSSPVRSSTVHHSGGDAYALRKGDWKLIFEEVEYGDEPDLKINWPEKGSLYNLKEDIRESTDLYDEYPELVSEMSEILLEYFENY